MGVNVEIELLLLRCQSCITAVLKLVEAPKPKLVKLSSSCTLAEHEYVCELLGGVFDAKCFDRLELGFLFDGCDDMRTCSGHHLAMVDEQQHLTTVDGQILQH